MTFKSGVITIITVTCIVFMMSCSRSNSPITGEGNEGGEESGTQLALDETYDTVRLGVRLVISYNAADSMFEGTIENTTDATIDQVRVEIHLSNGVELRPTPNVSLASGEKKSVTLDATVQNFTGWSLHAEVGSGDAGGTHN
ncbi:hypothetical protein F4212_09460 [Candidatus Poribacteria bacterium]|nr:hypothetical protein [Candidatus Poribacteria bacterium]